MTGGLIALFILGLLVGSFLNVLTLRIIAGESIVLGRSHCPHCKTPLRLFDMIPVMSYVMLRGNCRNCDASISPQYPLLELASAFAFVGIGASYFANGFSTAFLPLLVRNLVLTAGLLALFVFDVRWYVVPDSVSLPLIAFAFLTNLWLGIPLGSLLLGAAVGGGFYAILHLASRGRWVGSGDIRLGALLGVILSWPVTLVGLYLAYLIGGAFGILLLVRGKAKRGAILPMGVFLTAATFLCMLYPEQAAALASLFTNVF
ncbi:hypothetical protein COV04_00050 [Candidatus Uhrbacteria bacterium CG10_big_fil_rev_8_21_14_0_10_48_11]|uniref:Prepilin peptidase n=1 Tax=Candidatus Uhrbacteria bacterium CG10_big_fil_rev_8_21_14_0_10_48_11 TaxID=1975037 RepID=A0A2M8LFM6_9BACT|nr:MAG: hypothetical protein COV04_00050 [Candidatus Uhrbacteria bacterium CG10_big_fil_rev_8_21_14_0_10_48_11]